MSVTEPNFLVAKLHADAVIPTRATVGSAGYDLSACEEAVIESGTWCAVDTGIAIQIPSNCYARVAPRSGLAFKNGLDVFAGVVDSDYRSTIKVILMNNGKSAFVVNVGDRIGQLVFERIFTPNLRICEYVELTDTSRGTGGFGSTGIGAPL